LPGHVVSAHDTPPPGLMDRVPVATRGTLLVDRAGFLCTDNLGLCLAGHRGPDGDAGEDNHEERANDRRGHGNRVTRTVKKVMPNPCLHMSPDRPVGPPKRESYSARSLVGPMKSPAGCERGCAIVCRNASRETRSSGPGLRLQRCALDAPVRWWQRDAKTGDRQTQQDLARLQQVRDLRRAEQFELRQPDGILLWP
jgi:hypothetical protein